LKANRVQGCLFSRMFRPSDRGPGRIIGQTPRCLLHDNVGRRDDD